MNKITGGTWNSRWHDTSRTGGYGHFQIRNEAGVHVGSVWVLESTPKSTAEANANLFSLAPDLVRELRALCHLLHNKPECKTERDHAVALLNAVAA